MLLGNGDGALTREVRYEAGDQPIQALLEDFDGDSNPDLVVADRGGVPDPALADTSNGAGVSILKGNGDGTFASPVFSATTATTFLSLVPRDLQADDFNGDGNLDVAFRNATGVSILFGRGDGGLVVAPFSFGGREAGDLAVADFSGDGRLDVALGGLGRGVNVLHGNRDGTFLTPESFQTSRGLTLLTGDVNSHGNPDVINGNWLRLSNGDGAYRSPALNLGIGSAFPVAQVDLNGDSKLDLVTAEFNPFSQQTTVGVRLGNGDGAFAAIGSFTINEQVYSAAVADFNRDGKADLVLGQDTLLTVLLGNGDGTFAAPVQYVATVPRITGIAIGDLNGDSNPDLLLANRNNRSVIVLLGNSDGSFSSGVTLVTGSLGTGGVVAADFTGDGRLDFAISDQASTTGVLLFPGNGDGTFGTALGYALGQAEREGTAVVVALAMQDVNTDGRPDLLTASSTGIVNVILAQAGGTMAAGRTYLLDRDAPAVLTADLNRDGRPDLIAFYGGSAFSNLTARARVLLNRGDGTFQLFGDYDLQSRTLIVGAIGDFDGDGNTDLLADVPPDLTTSFTRRRALLRATQGAPLLGIVARLTDANPFETAGDFRATIAWGDGQTSAGTVISDGEGGFVVLGSNVFAQTGTYSVTTLFVDEDGGTATATGTVTVGHKEVDRAPHRWSRSCSPPGRGTRCATASANCSSRRKPSPRRGRSPKPCSSALTRTAQTAR